MSLVDFQLMADRHYWGRDRILDALENVPQEQLTTAQVAGLPPALELARHLMSFETFWFGTLVEGKPRELGQPATIAALRAAWMDVEKIVRDYLGNLTEEDLDRPMEIVDDDGQTYTPLIRRVLTQFEVHSGQHQAELALIATVLGHSPGEQGIWSYLEARGSAVPRKQ